MEKRGFSLFRFFRRASDLTETALKVLTGHRKAVMQAAIFRLGGSMCRDAAIQGTELLVGRFLPEPLLAMPATGKDEFPLAGFRIFWTPNAGVAHVFYRWL